MTTTTQFKTGDRVMYTASYVALFATNEKRKAVKSERGEAVYVSESGGRFVTVAWDRTGRQSMVTAKNLAIAPK
jgi:hypothetical protein